MSCGPVGAVVVVVENSLGDASQGVDRCRMVGKVGNGRILIGLIACLEGSTLKFGDDSVLQLTPSIAVAFKFLVVRHLSPGG